MNAASPISTAAPATPTHPFSGNYRWVICALLFFATTINYIDRQILALIKPILDNQLHWNAEQYGLANSLFQGAYGVSLFFFGWFVDKYGVKIGYATSIAAWSLAAAGHALVSTVGGFYGARIALGLGEGGNFPAAIKAIAQWFPRKERALATSIFNSGANVGAIIAPALVPTIALTYGWHAAFLLAGAAGMLWIALWLPLYFHPQNSARISPEEVAYIESDVEHTAADTEKVTWGTVLRHREAWSFVTAKFLTDPVWWFFLTWLPDFFKATRHLDIKGSQIYLVSIYGVITLLSIFGGWLPGYLTRQGWSVTRARKTSMFCFALLVLPIAVSTQNIGIWPLVFILGLAGAAHQAWSANLYTTVSDMFPKRAVATLTGVGGTAGAIGGMIFPWLTGKAIDKLGSSTAYTILFGFCAVAYLVSFAIHHVLAPKFEQVKDL